MTGAAVQVTHNLHSMLADLQALAVDPSSFLDDIGNALIENVRQGFIGSESPDGESWQEIQTRRKSKGVLRKAGDPPLRDNGNLMDSISYAVNGTVLTIGSDSIYAATHQYGDKKRSIPARPFLPLNGLLPSGWESDIEDVLQEHANGIL